MGSPVVDKVKSELKDKMDKAIHALKDEMSSIRTGRANPALLDRIRVDCYGTPMELRQVATISIPDPKTLTIQPWDKGLLGEIEKAIQKSDLGLPPSSDGKVVRLSIPTLTEERRKDLVKLVHKKGEERKVIIRNFRREGNETIKKHEKDHTVPEDEARHALDHIQKITDEYIVKIDEVVKHKEKDLMES